MKAEERAKKAEIKARQQAEKRQKKQIGARKVGVKAQQEDEKWKEQGAKRKADDTVTTPNPKSRISELHTQSGEDIDPNTCCTCFVRYEDDVLQGSGVEWISCACGRWLRKDCTEDCMTDYQGEERTCPFCLDILSA